jgi:hypothetical protein
MKSYPYHPINKKTGQRLKLRVTDQHLLKMNRQPAKNGYRGIVQDVPTGKWFRVWTHPCKNKDCCCDAIAVEITADKQGLVDPHE